MLIDLTEAIQGQRLSWNLVKKLGEGDAGEVYLVESVLDKHPAIVKRPRRGSFFSDILRQANQIKTEGSILKELPRVAYPETGVRLHTPVLIDQNRLDTELGEGTFIIIEQVKGVNLKLLSQVIRFGQASLQDLPTDPPTSYFLEQWSQVKQYPSQLLVRVLLGVLNLIETIHNPVIRNSLGIPSGVIWNDIKPEHLYWDPSSAQLTIIDWGNSQFLESNGITRDRQFSGADDFRQFFQEMGSFVAEANPQLHAQLEWPDYFPNDDLFIGLVDPLKEKLSALQASDSTQLQALRRQETDLYSLPRPGLDHIYQYQQLRQEFSEYGELPDSFAAVNFMFTAAYQLASDNKLVEFQEVCENAAHMPATSADKWHVLSALADIAHQAPVVGHQAQALFANALSAGVAGDWTSALWELFVLVADEPHSGWWEKLSQDIRKVCLGLEPDAIAPYTLFARLYFTLQAEVSRKVNPRLDSAAGVSYSAAGVDYRDGHEQQDDQAQDNEALVITVRDEIINKWKELEPNPPDSDITYSEVDGLLNQVDDLLPGWRVKLEQSLTGPKAQVDLVLDAWDRKDFEQARRGLRSILVWDPDRFRLLTADKAIATVSGWLARVHQGASKEEPFYDFLTSVELAGRRLRNQVGPARWLDKTLEAFKRLRRGTRSVDLILEYPEVMQELPWLNEYQSREILSLPHLRPLTIERAPMSRAPVVFSSGVVEGKFGSGQAMFLAEPLDTWAPEARGSSARVFAGMLNAHDHAPQPLAIKLMRPDKADYALTLFIEEVQVLTLLRDVPGITPFVECGYLKLDEGQVLPSDESHACAGSLSGQVIHYGVEQVQNFLAAMDRQLAVGWLPYLALVKRESEHNLLRYCDASYTHGWFLSLRDSLILSIQICDILQYAHDRSIIYRDHKILHYYWDPETHGVVMIDWNIAKRQPQGLSDTEKQFDLVQFGARGLHHIFAGRPAQGSLALGPNRPEEIENASTHYPVNWTYDDERLPNQVRSILEKALNQGYTQVSDMRQDLLGVYQQLSGTNPS